MPRQKKTTLCPLGGVGVGGKWQFWICYHLLSGTRRFGELQRLIPGASRQMLTLQLRELEQMGLVHRQVYAQAALKVEYSLTGLGRELEPIVRQFYEWAKEYCDQVGLEFDAWLVSLGGKWTYWIWYLLFSGPKRFGELRQLLPKANQQILTLQLRELERMGALHRQRVDDRWPPKTEYSLSEQGQSAEPVFRQMYMWGRWLCDQIGMVWDWPVVEDAPEGVHPQLAHAQLEGSSSA